MNGGQRAQKAASAGPAEYFDLFTDDGRPAGRERPAALLEPRPQPGVQRHTLEYAIEVCPFVQILNVPVPQVGDLVLDFLQKIDAPALDELVIAVPKISLDRIPQRSACRRPRRAEQLVEVPTIVSWSLLQLITCDAPRAMFQRLLAVCWSMLQLLVSRTWKSVHYFLRASCFFSTFSVRIFARVDFLGPSSTHSCELEGRGAGVAGSLLPGDSALGLCQFILRCRGHTRSLICH